MRWYPSSDAAKYLAGEGKGEDLLEHISALRVSTHSAVCRRCHWGSVFVDTCQCCVSAHTVLYAEDVTGEVSLWTHDFVSVRTHFKGGPASV